MKGDRETSTATDALLRYNIDKSTDQAIRGDKSCIFCFTIWTYRT